MFEQINNLFVHTVKRHFSHILYSTGISGIPIIHHPDPRTEYPRYGTCTCKLSEICSLCGLVVTFVYVYYSVVWKCGVRGCGRAMNYSLLGRRNYVCI